MIEIDNNEPLPYYKWLWRDWRANLDVQKLDYIAKGLYRALLDEQWCEGKIPSDRTRQALVCGCPTEVMEQHWSCLSPFFEEDEEGNRVNSKLEKQRTSSDKKRAALARNGKKGGRGRKAIAFDLKANPILEESNCHIAEQSRAEKSISEQDAENSSDRQEPEMNSEMQYEIICQNTFHKKANLRGWNGEQIKRLESIHKKSAVLRSFGEWCQGNKDNPDISDPVKSFVMEADDLLVGESPAQAVAKDPVVVGLVRELTYLSGGKVTFQGRHKAALAELLGEYSAEELTMAFKTFIGDKDLEEPYTLKYITGNYLDAADGLCYSARKHKQESTEAQIARDAVVARLQSRAEAERIEREKAEQKESELFDPLA